MLIDLMYYYASLEHKESMLKKLVSYSEKINCTEIDLNDFVKSKYPISNSKEIMPSIYALCDDKCINLLEGNKITMLPAAYNYLQKERIHNYERLKDSFWDLAKLILAALAGALLAKYIR